MTICRFTEWTTPGWDVDADVNVLAGSCGFAGVPGFAGDVDAGGFPVAGPDVDASVDAAAGSARRDGGVDVGSASTVRPGMA